MDDIEEGENCPNCDEDIWGIGNGCKVEVMEKGELVEVKRKCYTCLNNWTVWKSQEGAEE